MPVLKKIALFIYSLWAYFTFFLFAAIGVLYYIPGLLFIRDYNRLGDWMYWFNRHWALWWGPIVGIRYEIHGHENLHENQPCVIAANHGSISDAFIVAAALNVRYRPLGKVEVNKIPIMGYLFSKALVSVDRSNPESRKKSVAILNKVVQKHGISVLIFPEGTRNRTDLPLSKFYDGAFRLAIETQIPIVPMVLVNNKKIASPKSWLISPGLLKCYFLPPVPVDGLTDDDVPALKQQVHELMEAALLEYDPDLRDQSGQG